MNVDVGVVRGGDVNTISQQYQWLEECTVVLDSVPVNSTLSIRYDMRKL